MTVEDRECDVTSALTVRTLLDVASQILEKNLSLGSLIEGDEKVRKIQLNTKIYGLTTRQDNMFNRGDFNFLVETQRPRETI